VRCKAHICIERGPQRLTSVNPLLSVVQCCPVCRAHSVTCEFCDRRVGGNNKLNLPPPLLLLFLRRLLLLAEKRRKAHRLGTCVTTVPRSRNNATICWSRCVHAAFKDTEYTRHRLTTPLHHTFMVRNARPTNV